MTEVTWTLIYGFMLMITLMKGGMDSMTGDETAGHKWAVAIIAGFILMLPLALAYAAGAYVAVTGNAGTMGWFGIWIALIVIGLVKSLYDLMVKGEMSLILLSILGNFILYQMGAFANFSNF